MPGCGPLLAVLVLAAGWGEPGFGQLPGLNLASGQAAAPAAASSDPYHRETPRGAFQGFVTAAQQGRLRRAAEYLELTESERAARGAELARELQAVFDEKLFVNLDRLSGQPEGQLDDQLAPDRELVGTIDLAEERFDILLHRVQTPEGRKVWLISADTVRLTPALYSQVGHPEVERALPQVLVTHQLFRIPLWQWIAFPALLAVAFGLSWTALFLFYSLARVVRRLRGKPALQPSRLTAGPVFLTLALLIHYASVSLLGLPLLYRNYYNRVVTILLYSMLVWFGFRWADRIAATVQKRLADAGQSAANSMLLLTRRVVKVLVVVAIALLALRTLGFNMGGLLAGLGIGGVALAFAAQKTLENLFGGVSVLSDRAIRVGDSCKIGDVTGSIEDIGLRSTRVRTLDRTVVFVPNGLLATVNLENLTRRDKFWFHPTLTLRYETRVDQLRRILAEARSTLDQHTKIDSETLRVRFVNLGAYSLDVEVFAYVFAADYAEFLAIKEDLLLRLMDIVERAGAGLAFPSQTLYMAADGGPRAEAGGGLSAQPAPDPAATS